MPKRFPVPRELWEGMEQLGIARNTVLAAAGLPLTLGGNGSVHITTEQYFRIWHVLPEIPGYFPGAGFIGLSNMNWDMSAAPVNLATLFSSSYHEAILAAARFGELSAPARTVLIEESSGLKLSMDWYHSDQPAPSLLVELQLAFFVELGRRGTRSSVVPKQVKLVRPNPNDGVHEAYFGCPVVFDADKDEVLLAWEHLARPFKSQNAAMLEIVTAALNNELETRSAYESICGRTKAVLQAILSNGRPNIAAVAEQLNMSERTLQRRITEEGTTFRQLLLDARKELANFLLRNSSLEICEVSYLVGFDDVHSFYRAFKLWQGKTPLQWRSSVAAEGNELTPAKIS